MSTPSFAENLAALPAVAHIARLELSDIRGAPVGVIENRPGSAGSVAVYHAVCLPQGRLDAVSAARAIALYAEHADDARRHPGRHPNIDRLFELIARGEVLQVRAVGRE